MAIHKICPLCGVPFVTAFNKQIHCSRSCGSKTKTRQSLERITQYFYDRASNSDDPDSCWIWTGVFINKRPIAYIRKGRIYASRLSYELFIGSIPENMKVLHDPVNCNNPACVNPQHLRTGTQKDNALDRAIAETQTYGENHSTAKLTDEQVREMRRLYANGAITYKELAEKFDLESPVSVYSIIKAKTWKYLDADIYVPPGNQTKKLSDDDVRLIRTLYEDGMSCNAIATYLKHRVTSTHVWYIVAGKARANVI